MWIHRMRVCTVDSIQGTLACHPLFFLTPIPLTPPAFQRKSPSHFSLYLLGCLETPVAHQHPAPSDTSLMKKTPCTPSLPLATDLLTMTTPPNVYLSKINPHQVSLTAPMRHDLFKSFTQLFWENVLPLLPSIPLEQLKNSCNIWEGLAVDICV